MRLLARLAGLGAILAGTLAGLAACQAGSPAGSPAPQVGPGSERPSFVGGGLPALAGAYLAIARPANRSLDAAETSYAANAHRNLAAAEAALRAQAAIERRFDSQLLAIDFPPEIAATARALVAANNSRIAFTELQGRSTSIGALSTFTDGHRAVDAAVEAQVRELRRELGLPPPATS